MSLLLENNTLTFPEAEERLNTLLTGLKIVSVQNAVSDTRRLLFSIYSEKDDANFSFSIGTSNWSWQDVNNDEVPVFSDKKIDDTSLSAISNTLQAFLERSPTINRVELEKNEMRLQLIFSDNSFLIAKEDTSSIDASYYQLRLSESIRYQNSNLLIQKDSCGEKLVNGEEMHSSQAAIFNLDYFRMEHRNFTTHAIAQARQRTAPISCIQARVLYRSLTSEDELAFLPWKLRRSSTVPLRLQTIPSRELIAITRQECKDKDFTTDEAKDILAETIPLLERWLQSNKNANQIAVQEYGNEQIYQDLIQSNYLYQKS